MNMRDKSILWYKRASAEEIAEPCGAYALCSLAASLVRIGDLLEGQGEYLLREEKRREHEQEYEEAMLRLQARALDYQERAVEGAESHAEAKFTRELYKPSETKP